MQSCLQIDRKSCFRNDGAEEACCVCGGGVRFSHESDWQRGDLIHIVDPTKSDCCTPFSQEIECFSIDHPHKNWDDGHYCRFSMSDAQAILGRPLVEGESNLIKQSRTNKINQSQLWIDDPSSGEGFINLEIENFYFETGQWQQNDKFRFIDSTCCQFTVPEPYQV